MATSVSVNAKIARLVHNAELQDRIINGSDTTVVQTDGGLVPSMAKVMKDLGEQSVSVSEEFLQGLEVAVNASADQRLTAMDVRINADADAVLAQLDQTVNVAADGVLAAANDAVVVAETSLPVWSPTAPITTVHGKQWINSNTGRRFTYIVTASSASWVETGTRVVIGMETTEAAQLAAAAAAASSGLAGGSASSASASAIAATGAATTATTKAGEAAASAANAAATLAGAVKTVDLAASGGAETLVGSAAYSPGAGKRLGMLGAAVRYASGAIGLINDSGHLPVGITAVSALDDYTFQVDYSHGFTQVGALLASLDNDLAPYGIQVGASVGVSSATFVMYAPLIFTAQGDGTILNIAPFWEDVVSLNAAGSTSVIFNKPAGLNTNGPQVTPLTSGVPMLLSTAWGSTTVTVAAVGLATGGWGSVVYSGGNFVLSKAPVVSGGSISVAASGNACVITHPAVGANRVDRVPIRLNSVLAPEILSSGDTTTTVEFRKSDGSVATVAADSAAMQFNFTIGGLTPQVTLPATAKFTVDCGLCKVKLAQLGKVALNNLWLTGFMNKD